MYWGLLPSFDTFLEQKFINIFSSNSFNFELGDVTIVADDEQIKAHKFVLRSITFICIIHNVESVNVSLVTDNEHIKKHKDMRRAITFFIIHDVEPVLITDDEQVKAHKFILRFVNFFLDWHLEQKSHQITSIYLIHKVGTVNATLVTDAE